MRRSRLHHLGHDSEPAVIAVVLVVSAGRDVALGRPYDEECDLMHIAVVVVLDVFGFAHADIDQPRSLESAQIVVAVLDVFGFAHADIDQPRSLESAQIVVAGHVSFFAARLTVVGDGHDASIIERDQQAVVIHLDLADLLADATSDNQLGVLAGSAQHAEHDSHPRLRRHGITTSTTVVSEVSNSMHCDDCRSACSFAIACVACSNETSMSRWLVSASCALSFAASPCSRTRSARSAISCVMASASSSRATSRFRIVA